MINWDKINKKSILIEFAIISFLLITTYTLIIKRNIKEENFAKESEQIARRNSSTVFSLEKIYLCSSANGIDISENKELNEFELYQYTDIAIYINNGKEEKGLKNNNTVKQLYIDNIDLQLENKQGKANLDYTNLLKIGNKDEFKNNIERYTLKKKKKKRIDFNIINTNEQNENADYESPTFYADCSNPITLKYINKLNKNYMAGEEKTTTFDGTILKKAGISIQDINCEIKFKINIINNKGEYYCSWVKFQIPLDDIYNGISIKSRTSFGKEFDFITI